MINRKSIFTMAVFFALSTALMAGTIASFPKKKYIIGPEIKFSPDGSHIAFTARDGKKYYAPHNLYIGSSKNGRFKKAFNDPVNYYVWKNRSEIIFAGGTKDTVTIKSGNIRTGNTAILYSYKKRIKGSGYAKSYEKFDIKAISPQGKVIVEKNSGACSLINIRTKRETPLINFKIPYSGNPKSRVNFSDDGRRLMLFDGRKRSWSIYAVTGSSIKLVKKIDSLKGIQPGSDYRLSPDGRSIAFTVEKCKGGCYHIAYEYNFQSGTLKKLKTIRGGQILRVAFDSSFKYAVTNDMHRRLRVYRIK